MATPAVLLKFDLCFLKTILGTAEDVLNARTGLPRRDRRVTTTDSAA
jgi:hypothetical protein